MVLNAASPGRPWGEVQVENVKGGEPLGLAALQLQQELWGDGGHL